MAFEFDSNDTFYNRDDYDEYIEENLEDLIYDQEDLINRKTEEGIFSDSNYNFDTPVLKDKALEKLKFLKGFNCTLSQREKQDLRFISKNQDSKKPIVPKQPEELHNVISTLISKQIPLVESQRLLVDADITAEQTQAVPNAFLKLFKIQDNDVRSIYKPRSKLLSNFTKTYLEWFLIFHTITCIFNNIKTLTKDRFRDLAFSDKLKAINDKKHYDFMFKLDLDFEIFYITETSIFLKKSNIIFEKDGILLLKDICNSRFQTLSALEVRNDFNFKYGFANVMNNIYKKGDELLKLCGDNAYEIFALIEPFCNMLFSERSMEHRKLMPKFETFRIFVEGELEDMRKKYGNLVTEFFNMIENLQEVDELATVFGSFRHWGHPFIDYKIGLNELCERVTEKRDVDMNFVRKIASSFALRFIKNYYDKNKAWCFKLTEELREKCESMEIKGLWKSLVNGVWPTPYEIQSFGSNWHELEFLKVLEIPDVIDPSLIYSDKSHSLSRTELIRYINSNYGHNPNIPTHRVLNTFLYSKATNWPEFLSKVDREGLDLDQLIIALKPKERELKKKGRYFALMSWEMRQYFVITEYLIKEHFISMYDGLTMADDQVTLMKKIYKATMNQGDDNYESITITNGIDYSKWCNTQSLEATYLIFRVMDQLLGFNHLISRTHEIFQKSWIYYLGGANDFKISSDGTKLVNTSDYKASWNGQNGGLEGLRQKGWSVISLICLALEAESSNSSIKYLAQGDNQIVCNSYRVLNWIGETSLIRRLKEIFKNNFNLMERIASKISLLGLKINKSETMQSTDFLNYGKTLVYRGIVRCLETKRYSRMTCTTNDQLPNFGNTLSTVSSNCLTVSHQSFSCVNPINHYNWAGNLTAHLLMRFNPSLRESCYKYVKSTLWIKFITLYLYLDPVLGGLGGMSLTRFLIRGFPDPVNEALSFWKFIYNNTTHGWLKDLCCNVGYPRMKPFEITDLTKLVESPNSLNIYSTSAAENLIKTKIREELYIERNNIKNEIIKDSLIIQKEKDNDFLRYLVKVRPLFPKFLSEMYNSSFAGIVNSMVGLVQNARSIKATFGLKFTKQIQNDLKRMEMLALKELQNKIMNENHKMWDCSYQQAKKLRTLSWGENIIGADIPHPLELLGIPEVQVLNCEVCRENMLQHRDFILCAGFEGIVDYKVKKGKMSIYMGSDTKESTSINQSYEKETNMPMIKRAVKLLNTIGWFVEDQTPLARTLSSMVRSLTGEAPKSVIKGIKRTGCALHRYSNSRQSSGGYLANNASISSRIYCTTDFINDLNDENYTFMFQPMILFSKFVSGEIQIDNHDHFNHHFHFKCLGCVDEAKDITINAETEFEFPDMSSMLNKWKPQNSDWFKDVLTTIPEEISIREFKKINKSQLIGNNLGFFFSESCNGGSSSEIGTEFFPKTLRSKLVPRDFLIGLAEGIKCNAHLHAMSIHSIFKQTLMVIAVRTVYNKVIDNLAKDKSFLDLAKSVNFTKFGFKQRSNLVTRYPDDGHLKMASIHRFLLKIYDEVSFICNTSTKEKVLCGDFVTHQKNIDLYRLGNTLQHHLQIHPNCSSGPGYQIVKACSLAYSQIHSGELNLGSKKGFSIVKIWKEEIKVLVKEMDKHITQESGDSYRMNKVKGHCELYEVKFGGSVSRDDYDYVLRMKRNIFNPSISSLRRNIVGTSSFYKLNDIIRRTGMVEDYMVLGDGVGGFSSYMLLNYVNSSMIYNSLIGDTQMTTNGGAIDKPALIDDLPEDIKSNCVNFKWIGSEPTDLRQNQTWNYFNDIIKKGSLKISHVIIDMESQEVSDYDNMFNRIIENFHNYKNATFIIKIHLLLFIDHDNIAITKLLSQFKAIKLAEPEFRSSNTDEFYFILQGAEEFVKIKSRLNIVDTLIGTMSNLNEKRSLIDDWKRFYRLQKKSHLYNFYPQHKTPDYKHVFYSNFRMYHKYNDFDYGILDIVGLRMEVKLSLLIIKSMLHILPIHYLRNYLTSKTAVLYPSSQQLIKFFGLFGLLNLYVSLVSGDYYQYRGSLSFLNQSIYVYIRGYFVNEEEQETLIDYYLEPQGNRKLFQEISTKTESNHISKLLKCMISLSNFKRNQYLKDDITRNLEKIMDVRTYKRYENEMIGFNWFI